MSDNLDMQKIKKEGLFTVTRVKPIEDEKGNITIATCGCGCHGSVSVSNTGLASNDEGPEVLHLQR